jgi:hypothetical protein
MSMMMGRLVDYAKGKTTKHTMMIDNFLASLKARSAKFWIDEQRARAEKADDIRHLIVDLEVEPWLTTARSYVAAPSQEDPNTIKAVNGVKAPTGTVLEVKGAFIDEDGEEHIPEDKKDRSLQIHLYGYT